MLSTAFWMQDDHRATTEAVGNALDSQPRQRNYCPSLFPAQWPLGRILGTTRRWLISGRFFTYKFGAHPRLCGCATMGQLRAGVHWNTLEIFEKCERHRFLMSGATPTRSQRRRLAVLGGKERVLSFLVLPYCCSW